MKTTKHIFSVKTNNGLTINNVGVYFDTFTLTLFSTGTITAYKIIDREILDAFIAGIKTMTPVVEYAPIEFGELTIANYLKKDPAIIEIFRLFFRFPPRQNEYKVFIKNNIADFLAVKNYVYFHSFSLQFAQIYEMTVGHLAALPNRPDGDLLGNYEFNLRNFPFANMCRPVEQPIFWAPDGGADFKIESYKVSLSKAIIEIPEDKMVICTDYIQRHYDVIDNLNIRTYDYYGAKITCNTKSITITDNPECSVIERLVAELSNIDFANSAKIYTLIDIKNLLILATAWKTTPTEYLAT